MVTGGNFMKKERNTMYFIIEEIASEQSIYTYQGSCVFDEFLEFYAFLNVFGISAVGQEEKSEHHYLKPDKALEMVEIL
jgi:hypothetical protein